MSTFELCPEPTPEKLLVNRAATLHEDAFTGHSMLSQLKVHHTYWLKQNRDAHNDVDIAREGLAYDMAVIFTDLALERRGHFFLRDEHAARRAVAVVAMTRLMRIVLPIKESKEHTVVDAVGKGGVDFFPEMIRDDRGSPKHYALHVHSVLSNEQFGEPVSGPTDWYSGNGLYVRRETNVNIHPVNQAELAARGLETDYANMHSLFPYLADARAS